jgi:hypothetical protein
MFIQIIIKFILLINTTIVKQLIIHEFIFINASSCLVRSFTIINLHI